jgi:hypothetical protein
MRKYKPSAKEPLKSQLLLEAENLTSKLQKRQFIEKINKIRSMRLFNEEAIYSTYGNRMSGKRQNQKKKENKIVYVF